MENNKKILIVLFCVFVIALCAGLYWNFSLRGPLMINNGETKKEEVAVKNNLFPKDDYNVVLKDNLENASKTEIYLKDKETGVENLFVSIIGVNKNTLNPAEFYKGNLYLITRNTAGEDWVDELWKYDLNGNGTKIYSGKGLMFVISRIENKIVLNKDASIEDNKAVVILDLAGKMLKGFEKSEISIYSELSDDVKKDINEDEILFSVLNPSGKSIFIRNFRLTETLGITNIDLETMVVEKYNFSVLGIVGQDYSFNSSMNKVVFSTYPAMFDPESVKEFAKNKNNKVNFYYYDLESKNKISLGTSAGRRFYPSWVDDNNFRYADPTEIIPEFGSITKWITKNISEVGQ